LDHHLLYICQNAIGDIITSLPSIHFLRSRCAHIDVLVNRQFADIFAVDPYIDRLIYLPSEWFDARFDNHYKLADSRIRALFGFYDVIVDSLCTKATTELIQLLNPALSVGIEFGEQLSVYSRKVDTDRWRSWSDGFRTASDCFGDLVRAYCIEYTTSSPRLYVSDDALVWAQYWYRDQGIDTNSPIVALNPGAGNVAKRWPIDRYIELAAWLHKKQHTVFFVFGPKEMDLFHANIEAVKQSGAHVIHFKDSRIQRLAGLLRNCWLTISNDCAVMHIAAAIGCPTLAIFGPTNSKIWFPYNREMNCVIEQDVPCRQSCISGCDVPICLIDISVSDVVATALQMVTRQQV